MTTPSPPGFGGTGASSRILGGGNDLQSALDKLTTAVQANTTAVQQSKSNSPGGTSVPFGSTGQTFTSGSFPKMQSMAPSNSGPGGYSGSNVTQAAPMGGAGTNPAGTLGAAGNSMQGAVNQVLNGGVSTQLMMNQFASQSTLMMGQGNVGQQQQQMYGMAFGTFGRPAGLSAIAQSPADQAQMYSNLQGIAANANPMATAQGRAGYGATAGFGYANPALGGAGSSAAAGQLYSGQTSFAMRQLGYGGTPRAGMGQTNPMQMGQVMQTMMQRWYGKSSVSASTLNAGLANNGKLNLNLQALGLDPSTMGPALQMYNKLFQQGVGATQAQTMLNDAAQNKNYGGESAQKLLSGKYGIATSDLQKMKNGQAVSTANTAGEMPGFDSAISQSTTLLKQFNTVLGDIMKVTGLGKALGAAHGLSAGLGSLSGTLSGLAGKGMGMLSGLIGGAAGGITAGGGGISAGGTTAGGSNGASPGSTTGSMAKSVSAAIKDAESQVGKPYVWGGDNPQVGFDCSGLVEWAYGQAGIKLPRTSQAQWAALQNRSVSLDKVQAGDIVFSAGSDGTATAPGHEAMMISNKQIIEAPYCVPTDTEILTRHGWMLYDDLCSDDETLGYNLETQKLEWTPILEVHVFEDVPVMRAGTSTWNVEATANHRWVNQSKLGTSLVPMNEMAQGSRVILSAPADTKEYLDILDAEAELLAWAEGDGSIRVRGGSLELNITQSNPVWVAHLKNLLAGMPHTESVRKPDPRASHPQHVWYFPVEYARDLLARAEYFELSPSEMVLAMSPSQRAAWLKGMWGAEGSKTRMSSTPVITQNDGPVQDAIALCMYLLGYRPRHWKREPGRHCHKVTATNPRMAIINGQFSIEPSRNTDVWCPTTGLGTWTARQGDRIFVTGNTGADIRIRAFNPGEWQHAGRPTGSMTNVKAGSGGGNGGGITAGGTGGSNGTGSSTGSSNVGNGGLGLAPGSYGSSSELANTQSALLGGGLVGGSGGAGGSFGSSSTGNGQGSGSVGAGASVPTSGGGSNSANMALAQKMAQQMYGWKGSQWTGGLKPLWTQESGFNSKAQNPTSTAFGIAQFLDSTWGPYGPKTSNPGLQIKYGLEYIHDRYGNPLAAEQHERGYNWYAGGTSNAMPGMALVGERGPELVRLSGGQQIANAGQTADILKGSAAKAAQVPWNAGTAAKLMLANQPQNAAMAPGKCEVNLNMPQGAIVIHTTGGASDVSNNVRQIMAGVSQAMSDDETLKKIMAGVTS